MERGKVGTDLANEVVEDFASLSRLHHHEVEVRLVPEDLMDLQDVRVPQKAKHVGLAATTTREEAGGMDWIIFDWI